MSLDARLLRHFAGLGLATDAVSLVSHAHGRERRAERGIARLELQGAVKHGRKERAHPGRDGADRWRFKHKGVIYITDESCRHEITSWRLADDAAMRAAPPKPWGGSHFSSHTLLIVDSSGSMRRSDVPGYGSRTEAVYDTLLREFVQPQLELTRGGTVLGTAVVTLIEMGKSAEVLLERAPIDDILMRYFRSRGSSRARSHGNYLPALHKAIEILREDADRQVQLFLVLLSDGAPSDHSEQTCVHGVQVWQEGNNRVKFKGKTALRACVGGQACRLQLKKAVEADCLARIEELGDLLGRDRMNVHTVAFGDPKEDYSVLERIAGALPRGSFQKLGLAAANLRTAFTSLNQSLTTMRTEADGSGGLTRRRVKPTDEVATDGEGWQRPQTIYAALDGWNVYVDAALVSKQRFDQRKREFVNVRLGADANGVAVYSRKFAEGAERCVFRCFEVGGTDAIASAAGERLVAKETLYVEQVTTNCTDYDLLTRYIGSSSQRI